MSTLKDKINKFFEDPFFIFQALTSNSNDYIYLCDMSQESYIVSANVADDFAINQEGNNFVKIWHPFIHARDIDRVKDALEQAFLAKQTKIKIEYQVANSRGNYIWVSDRATVRYNKDTMEPELVIGVMHNLSFDGKVDSVTGLFMHNKCKDILAMIQMSKVENYGSIMMLGIDNFTSINTLHSHAYGDLVLRTTSQAILNFLPEGVSMYRYDGDQFIIIAERMSKADIHVLYKMINEYTSKPHEIQDKIYRFTISAGVASYPEDGFAWIDLEKAVSIALKTAKETGEKRYVEFTSEMFEEKMNEQSLSRYIVDSIEHDFMGFKVVFQPVCYAQSLKIKGAEILLRFVTPDGELINPDQFIPLLEHSQLIIPVGFWVLEQAIKACKKWIDYCPDFVMNVNVSYIQLRDVSFCDTVELLLKKYDLDVRHITLELTESYFITDASNINISMRRLQELHLQVAMDDFGTGYSSLARLSQFNVDVVKIDRSFVQSLHKSKYNYDFVDSVVRLCHNVGMKVCVEGVESRDEQASICLLNVDFIQGFYISRPIEEDVFFITYIAEPHANDTLIVVPDMQLRHEQLVSDKDVLLAMMDATPLGLNFWNRNLEIIACNVEVLHLFGAKDFDDFKQHFYRFSPTVQPDGLLSMDKVKVIIKRAFEGEKINLTWLHCNCNQELIPTEVTVIRIPYMNDYLVASYTRDMRKQILMEDKVEKFNLRLKAVLDASPLSLNLIDTDYESIMCNKAAVQLFDLKDELEYIKNFYDLSPEYQADGQNSIEKAKRLIDEAFILGKCEFTWTYCKKNGEEIPAEVTLIKIEGLNEEGKDLIAAFTRDIRVQIEAESIQKIMNQRIRAVLDSSPLACILWNDNLDIVDCNQVAVNMFGAANKEEIFHNFDSFIPEYQPDGEISLVKKNNKFKEIFETGNSIFEWVYRNKNNENIPCEVTLVKVALESEEIIVAYSRDLRELHQTLELNHSLSQIAYFDLVTGVSTRARFIEKLELNFNSETNKLALLIFDIDYFKTVNDRYGHEAGDIVLKRVAKTIEKLIPETGILGRYGGDEFIIQVCNLSEEELYSLMNRFVHCIAHVKFHYNNQVFTTSISVGASFKLASDVDYHQLINRADKALYEAKGKGRNCSVLL